jgi:hypothetical protein
MLERLLAALANGPSLNCKPHSSRQRIDLTQLAKFKDRSVDQVLSDLLGEQHAAKVAARVPAPAKKPEPAGARNGSDNNELEENLSPEEKAARQAWVDQQSLVGKLRTIAEDAKTYENDTGVHVLHIGYPLLSLPPGASGIQRGFTRRILAPIAFISVNLSVRGGAAPAIVLECRNHGQDLVVPNAALLAWLEQQTGAADVELDPDETGEHPWQEIADIVRRVAQLVETQVPEPFAPSPSPGKRSHRRSVADGDPAPGEGEKVLRPNEPPAPVVPPPLRPAPRAEEDDAKPTILPSAILGLFPVANQGLLRDMQALASGEPISGPLDSFLSVDTGLVTAPVIEPEPQAAAPIEKQPRNFADERLIAAADPCQARAVKLARTCRGLVIHGPPGTGKSQTIANIIGDHLSRGQRVLMVCDKRTAIDVVMYRLDALGLGQLCAVVHDPQRDQRELYKAIREQLDGLADAKTYSRAASQIKKVDKELESLHQELSDYHCALMDGAASNGVSFHELMGQWLSLPSQPVEFKEALLKGIAPDELERNARQAAEIFERATTSKYADNPWADAAGLTLREFLGRPMEQVRQAVANAVETASAADATSHPLIPPFDPQIDLQTQAQKREQLAASLSELASRVNPAILAHWASAEPQAIRLARQKITDVAVLIEVLKSGPLDTELSLTVGAQPPALAGIAQQIGTLDAYLPIADKWYGFLSFGIKSAARRALTQYGLPLNSQSAQRLRTFLAGLRARLILRALNRELLPRHATDAAARSSYPPPVFRGRVREEVPEEGEDDQPLAVSLDQHHRLFDLLLWIADEPSLHALNPSIVQSLIEPSTASQLIEGLKLSPARAQAIANLEKSLADSNLFRDPWLAAFSADVRQGQLAVGGSVRNSGAVHVADGTASGGADIPVCLESASAEVYSLPPSGLESVRGTTMSQGGRTGMSAPQAGKNACPTLQKLSDRLGTLEQVLRVREGLVDLPSGISAGMKLLIKQHVEKEPGMIVLKKSILALEIARRLKSDPILQTADAHRLKSSFERYRTLDAQKKSLVRDVTLDHWITRQRDRLLASTGSRLNGQGADLRRRLTIRGLRAMRLRQVVAIGREIEGGDPLFDLRPVWMCSPETVAQVFARKPLFDVVIFDEASQCRLEEALPVLTRAQRVVIAGDPKQLPPTRFFESAIVASDQEDAETQQEWFEVQQGEIEDLLGAALNIEIQECYLDVHYRSRNADLIEFSNRQFYNSRLQPIPGHPSNRSRFAPLTLYKCNGVYDKNCNIAEAEQVCRIVVDLLKRADPPSIGIACFNIQQRDLILDRLDDQAAEDSDFGRRLNEARNRRGKGSFDGLFVKNLESVQGDERDHMIVSTTYGPDPKGKFYRRFGPLGRAGGGRRLNVLVTRAREEVHLVTSIPESAYRALPPVPQGQTPGGAWLLFSYLAYAQELTEQYELNHRLLTQATPDRAATVNVRPSRWPSLFSQSLGNQLARNHNTGSDVHWGNDGFCVDLALHHPRRLDDVTLGVICDLTRFAQAEDAVEWEAFRTAIHESQGWTLHRLWTPHFFRDPQGCTASILKHAAELVSTEQDKDAIPVRT